ncbi:unnamed protein product [Closterium sp. NIES-54]
MCEAGEDTLLESLKLKGADIPPQSEQQQQDEGESDDVVEVDLETKVKDLSAEQAVQAAQINSLSEDMDHLKDSVFKGGEGIVKLTLSMSSLLTAFQQQAAHAGFKLPMAALEGLNRPEVGDSTAAVVAPGTTRGALHTSAVASSLVRRPLFGQIPGFVQAQGATSGAQRSRASDTGPAAGASSSAADQVGAVACVTTAAAGQPGASVRAPPAGAGQPGAYAGAPPAGAVQPSSSAGALLAGVRLPGATAGVSPAAAGQPGAAAVIPTAAAGHPSVEAGVSTAAAGQPVAAAAIPIAAAGQPKAVAGVLTAVAGQPGSAGVALTAAAAQPCATAGTPKAAAGQHGPATGVAINAGVVRPGDDCWDILGPGSDLTNFPPCVQVQDATGSQAADDAPRTAEPPTFLFAAEALDTGSILPGHTSSAPRGTLLNMPSQQVLPSPAASSSFMPSTQALGLSAPAATAAPAYCATMASLRVLVFDHEGRPVQFDTWLDDLHLYLLSDINDGVSLFDHMSGAATAPPATADSRLLLPYLFPELSALATVEDLVSHLRTFDARYRATVPAEFLDRNQPPMFITLYFIVTRLPDSLCSVRDHFLSLDPTSLTVDLLEQHLIATETSAVAVGAARGTPRPPFFEGCSPSPLTPSYASATAADVPRAEDVGATSASAKRCSGKSKGSRGGGGGSGSGGGGSNGGRGGCGGGGSGGSGGGSGGVGGGDGGGGVSGGSGGGGTGGGRTSARRGGSGGGQRQQQQRRSETQSPQLHTQHRFFYRLDNAWRVEFGGGNKLPRWADLLRSRVAIFDLDFDAILSTMYALSVSAEGDCYRCVLPDPGIAAAALGASESGTFPGTATAKALHTFTLDSGASRCFFRDSTTLTPLLAPVPVRLADPSGGPVVACSSTVLPCAAVPFGSLSSLHSPRSLRTWSLPPLPPSRAPPCLPCVEGRQRAAPHSSSFPPTSATLQTLHMDVWGPARVSGQGRACYFLLVIDDYTWYTTVFPLRSKGEVVDVLIPWIRTVRLQLRERFS